MRKRLHIRRQPSDETCGPTCLAAVYNFYQDPVSLESVIDEVQMLEEGGTLAPLLGIHSLSRGYEAEIYSFNIKIFDPAWFGFSDKKLIKKLTLQIATPKNRKTISVCKAYRKFLKKGGRIRFADLTREFLSEKLAAGPIICGLSSTYLYKASRENPRTNRPDDVRGEPAGHFVVLANAQDHQVEILDPYFPNPVSSGQKGMVAIDHLINSVLLGVITYDANLLIIRKKQ
ncbi:MAG: peptidase-C39 like family protein [Deltaproteobacteria bacterium]|nr:peptidase-C39 like family protein [Deltaproteobacteria bacterium]